MRRLGEWDDRVTGAPPPPPPETDGEPLGPPPDTMTRLIASWLLFEGAHFRITDK